MSPICQSQFIPLSEVLCSVISDMNVAHVMVNQEALINHMMKAHPGMAIPTQEILYNALGALIKERKIYHTGEGYFIVTPQTYFITNNLMKEQNWWTNDNERISPPPITYLMSNESCLDASNDVPIMAHCKSCSCFTPQQSAPASVQEQSISLSECTGKSLKWPREHKPTVQHQSTSTAADYQASEISKSTATSRKDKEKPGRKFGLNLFRRNTGKKETKIKKEYATFSGQFPPEEWPVRDEDDLNNLPRDLEHAIIKRINPELTVDNLVRHTVLMKKMEEKAERVTKALTTDKGMSTEILLPKQRHISNKAGGKKLAPKASRSRKRGPSVKQRTKDKDGDDLIPSHLRPELVQNLPPHNEDCAALDAQFVHKKRIEAPFQSMPGCHTVVHHKEPRRREGKTSSRRERAGHRSKSWDPHCDKGINEDVQSSIPFDRSCEQLHKRELNLDCSIDAKTIQELSCDYSSFYPENSTLRIDDKVKQKGREFSDGRVNLTKQVLQDRDLKPVPDPMFGTDFASLSYETTALPVSWPKPPVRCRLSLHVVNSKEESEHCPDLLSSHHQTGGMAGSHHLVNSERVHGNHADSDAHTDAEHHIYQNVEVDDDGCSSLCLNDEHVNELVHAGTSRSREPVCFDENWDSSFITKNILTLRQDSIQAPQRQHEYRWPQTDHKPGLSNLPVDCSSGGNPQHVTENLNKLSPGLPEPTDTLDISIFDYSQMSEGGSDTETVLKSADDDDDQPSHWISHSQDPNQNQSVEADNLQPPSVSHCDLNKASPGETVENQSNTADSGIDSPRARMSLTSTNSVILKGLKRQNFLQNLEKLHSKSSGIHPQSSLLQLTPVMNV
ncbi:Storkhead-box protein 1 [Bagarius yarrelli]|uniref:Storkhead-box protein 1 n=1 Tax=Bagarius yarrelli TaxID=175774 RepID=A0A556V6A3_BAGYA|nr:Storkhead-box protein 1 [Bagarius yarrelli]